MSLESAAAKSTPRRREPSGGTTRSTVDLPDAVNRDLRRAAIDHDLSLQAILAALATAYAEGDERARSIVQEFSGS